MKTLFVLLHAAKLGPALWSALSIVLSIWVYAQLYGFPFAAGFVALILVHELGHYLAARDQGLPVGLPMFIPFLGAWIGLKDRPVNAETEAYIAYAGPLLGTIAALFCYAQGRHTGDPFWLALALTGFVLNLFNLIPLSPLDGGRITAVLTPRVWFLGVPILVGLWFVYPSPLLILVAALAVPQLLAAWRYDPAAEENAAYYGVPFGVRAQVGILYLGLAAFLAVMIFQVHRLLAATLA